MTKTKLYCLFIGTGLVIVVVGLISTVDHWYWPMIGRRNGEAFFRGRPTSYWEVRLQNSDSGTGPYRELQDGWPESSPVLLQLLDRDSRGATVVLGSLGPKAESALPAIRRASGRSTSDPFAADCDDAILQIAPEEWHRKRARSFNLELLW